MWTVHLIAGAGSVVVRVTEKLLLLPNTAERYSNREISFKEATDGIVKNIRIYVPLTTAKLVCDVIIVSMTGLINCGFQAFQNGIKLSLHYFFTSLRNCSIGFILNQFKCLYEKPKNTISSISIIDLCNISNLVYLSIIGTTNDLTKTIQLELMKYWLECMGIIRAIAESHNINFVKYMNRCCSQEMKPNKTSSLDNDHSFELKELQWERVKDPDFTQIINVSLEDIFSGTERTVIVKRKIRDSDKRIPEIEEPRYTVIIEPGCVNGKTFRFIEAGHRDPVNIPGDLIVKIQTEQHQLYERSDSDLIYKAKISLEDALRGVSVHVPLIDGQIKDCNPRGVITPKTEIIIDQGGLPDPTNDGIRGRLIVKFDIEFPDTKLGTEPIEQYIHN